MTSKSRMNIPEQPPPTCPIIDRAIKSINDVAKAIRSYERVEDIGELKDMLSDVEYLLFGWNRVVVDQLEEVRTNAEKIRAWGQAWKDLALEEIDKREELEESE